MNKKKNQIPKFDTSDTLGVLRALNWFNLNSNKKKSRGYLLDFLLDSQLKSDLANIKRIPENELLATYGYVAKLLLDGYELPVEESNKFMDYINKLSKEGAKIPKPEPKKNSNKPPTTKAWSWYSEVNNHLGEVDHAIDVFLLNDYQSDFSMYNFLKDLPVMLNKRPKILEIKKIYEKQHDEIQKAYDKTDSDLVDAYGYMGRRNLKKYLNFLDSIVQDTEKYADYLKPKKKVKKTRTPNRMKMVKNFKFKEEDVDLGLRSEDPVNIPGSIQVWVFNTKNRLLFHYDAEDKKQGLSVSGSSLKGYNRDTSKCKKIKKPFNELQSVLKSSRGDLLDVFNKIPGKDFGNGQRINKDMLIVRILR